MERITVARSGLVAALATVGPGGGLVDVAPASRLRRQEGLELVVSGFRTRRLERTNDEPGVALVVAGESGGASHVRRLGGEGARWAGVLIADATEGGGSLRAFTASDGGWVPAEICLVGPRMAVLPSPRLEVPERWSRLAGAIGDRAWARLRTSAIGVVGCGRSGSMLATSLVRSGVGRVVLVDPDRVEAHNLDAMDGVSPDDLGRTKVQAVGAGLEALRSGTRVEPAAASVVTVRALSALRGCDVLACCADDDGARWATGVIGALYLRPVLDIGVGVLGRGPDREAGADLRLLVLGEACPLCLGGLADPDRVAVMRSGKAPPPIRWSDERAGSLRSMNMVAVGLAVRLLEDLYEGRLRGSSWITARSGASGEPSVSTVPDAPTAGCPLCAMHGTGHRGLALIRELPDGRNTRLAATQPAR